MRQHLAYILTLANACIWAYILVTHLEHLTMSFLRSRRAHRAG